MDEYIDELLREERACDIILPRIQVRLLVKLKARDFMWPGAQKKE